MKIKVNIVDRGEKGFYYRWRDQTGRICEEKTGLFKRKEAWQAVPAKQDELERRLAGDGSILWAEWRDIVDEDYCGGLAVKSMQSTDAILNCVERTIKPHTLADITTPALTRHATEYRRLGRSENTIASHFATLKAVLNWSIEQGYLTVLPKFPRLARATGTRSRGRAMTDAEFAKMLAAVKTVVPAEAVESWKRFLEGLWLSGLRLSEGLKLSWQPSKSGVWLDFSDEERPKLVMRSGSEKGKRDRLLPLTPDFATFLREMPGPRLGPVFAPMVRYGRTTASRDQCSHVISAIGKASSVETEPGRTATAHDLRRSFGLRWAMLVTPAVLQQLMRHASIQTTLEFYARADADRWGDEVYAAWNNKSQRKTEVNGQVNQK